MRDPGQTPLKPDERAHFRGISWFPIQAKYRVTARFVRTPSAKTFFMPTSSGKPKVYTKFGILTFTLNHHACRLAAYQSQSLLRTQPDEAVFVPFTDKTSGTLSYGGGRYLDFPVPKSGLVTLDFNDAYNPYCAYTEGFACPIPPSENRLPVAVLAGAKVYRH